MNKIKRFMIIDMLFFLALAIISELLGNIISPDLLYVSFAQVLLLTLLIRWEWWGLIPLGIFGIIRPFIQGIEGFNEYLVYSIPILLLGLALIPIKLDWMEDVRKKKTKSLLYFTTFYLIYLVGEGLIMKIFVSNEFSIINNSWRHSLTFVFGNIIMFILALQKTMLINVLENSETYEKDREEDGNG